MKRNADLLTYHTWLLLARTLPGRVTHDAWMSCVNPLEWTDPNGTKHWEPIP